MSVRPTNFDDPAAWLYVHDDARPEPHGGTLDPATVVYGTAIDGSHNHNFMVMPCPFAGCGSVSTHPVGGGADAPHVQRMFVDKTQREGCACGNVEASSNGTPEAHVHLNVSRMDGPERWQLDDGAIVQSQASDKQFQVVYRKSDGLVVGTHPKGGVGNQNGVSVIHDMAEWDVLMRTDPAYLSADGDHIVSTPQAAR